MNNNLLRMQKAINQNRKNYTKTERISVIETFNGFYDKVANGEIRDVPPSTLECLLHVWTRPVQALEKVFAFSIYFVENIMLFFKGLKRIKRKPESNKNEYICFSGVV